LREAKRSKPELAKFIEEFPKEGGDAYIAAHFAALPKISVDYAIMEKAERVTVAEARFDWTTWGAGRHSGAFARRRPRQYAARSGGDS